MRPVTKGPAPPNAPFNAYPEALEPLTEAVGWYCSYCERRLEVNLAIEHVQPKSLTPALELEWDNFLLACTNCNSTKGSQAIQLDDFYWPDADNTVRAFVYEVGGVVDVDPALTQAEQDIARRTLELTGLDRRPGGPHEPTNTDRRWIFRRNAFDKAMDVRADLQHFDSVLVRNLIRDLAVATGYWSVWFTVFSGDADMRQRLVDALPGTDPGSFDGNSIPVPRPGGAL